jgi:hypothetical protein
MKAIEPWGRIVNLGALIEAQTRRAGKAEHVCLKNGSLPGRLPQGQVLLFSEDLHHGFILGLIDLSQGLCHQGTVFKAAVVQHLVEPEGGVAEQDLSVLKAFVVLGHGEMDLVRQYLNLLQQASGFLFIAGSILVDAEFGHLVDQLGVEETLFAGLGLEDFGLKSVDALLIDGFVVEA